MGTTGKTEKPLVFHVNRYSPDSPNGIHRVIYSYGQVLNGEVNFQAVSTNIHPTDQYDTEEVEKVTVHRFGHCSAAGFRLPGSLQAWLKSIPKTALFHLHGVFNPANYAIARALTEAGLRYIYTPHDSYSEESLRKNYWAKHVYITLFEKYILNHAQMVHALTAQGVRDIQRHTSTPVILIPNFVMNPHITGINTEGRKHILFVGRMDIFQKGIDLMLEAYSQYRQLHPAPLPLVLLGPDEGGSIAQLIKMSEHLHLVPGQDVIFTGKVSEAERIAYIQQSRVYFQLSRFEGFGMSVVEAMAYGIPVVISPGIPIADSIIHYQGGYIVPDVASAAQQLCHTAHLPESEYQTLAHNSLNTYLLHYSPDVVKAQLITMYRQVNPAA